MCELRTMMTRSMTKRGTYHAPNLHAVSSIQLQSRVYSIYYRVYSTYYRVYSIHYRVYSIYYRVYSIYYRVYSIYYRVYSIYYRVYSIHYRVYSIYYILYSIYYRVYSIHYMNTQYVPPGSGWAVMIVVNKRHTGSKERQTPAYDVEHPAYNNIT